MDSGQDSSPDPSSTQTLRVSACPTARHRPPPASRPAAGPGSPALPAGQGLACPGAHGRWSEQKKPRQCRPGTLPHAAPHSGAGLRGRHHPLQETIFPMVTAAPPPWVKESQVHTAAPVAIPASAPHLRAPELPRPRCLGGSQVSPARLRLLSRSVALGAHLPLRAGGSGGPLPVGSITASVCSPNTARRSGSKLCTDTRASLRLRTLWTHRQVCIFTACSMQYPFASTNCG